MTRAPRRPGWTLRLVALVALALAPLPSCGGQSSGDSSSHWLSPCRNDGDCGALECICSVCTKPCANPSSCSDLSPTAECAPLEVTGCTVQSSVCVAGREGVRPLDFSPCPLVVTQPFTAPPSGPVSAAGFDGQYSTIAEWLAWSGGVAESSAAMAECATTPMPASWSAPDGDTIDVFVKRYPAAVQPATGQLWMLEGSAGFPGSTQEYAAYFIGAALPTLDVYLPDHRGTGQSTLAVCPVGLPDEECAATIPHLAGLTVTDAARDLAALIDGSRPGARQVFVYGASYGTYWAQRYLQIRPDQPTAVILDSTYPAGINFAEGNRSFDAVTRTVLALCEADATCSAKGGPGLVAKAEQAVASVTNPCPGGLVRQVLNGLVGSDCLDRLLLPAAVHRLHRCSEADQAWIEQVRAYSAWRNALFRTGHSPVVQRNIEQSELWDSDRTAEDFWFEGATLLAVEGGVAGIAEAAQYWPRYPRDAYHGRWPSSPAPVLVLKGGLDARTTGGDLVSAHYSGENHHYVEVPWGTYGTAYATASPVADLTAPGCGFQVMQSFLEDPTRAPDTSCIAGPTPLDWSRVPPEWMALVGIEDLWGDP